MKNTAITVINGRSIRIARAGASRSQRNQWKLDAITSSSARRLVRVIVVWNGRTTLLVIGSSMLTN